MTVNDLKIGQSAIIRTVGGSGTLRRRLLDMGVIPGAEFKLVKRAPMGDPVELFIRGYNLSLRISEAGCVDVEPVEEESAAPVTAGGFGYNLSLHDVDSHPGLGEGGVYHSKDHENPLPKGTPLNLALVGQHNCGKTALFNRLTGSNLHVGNFPGVTMERADGAVRGYADVTATDLPGIYSLSAYSDEEQLTRDYILTRKPECLINVVDANNIERNLYLTIQLMELGIPMVLALNMMDEVRGNGGSVDVNGMENALGIPVVPVAASRGEGISELLEHAVHVARYRETPVRQDFCDPEDCGGAVHRCLHGIAHLVEDHAFSVGLQPRFVAERLTEGDDEIKSRLALTPDESDTVEKIILQMEKETSMDRNAAMARMRFEFIHRLCSRTVSRPGETKEQHRSIKIDRILTGKYTAIPTFLLIIALVFILTFDVIGFKLQKLFLSGLDAVSLALSSAFERWSVSAPVRSLVIDAVLGGVGSVVSFIPIILVLFFFLSLLEDSGYMARIAFVSDKLLRRIGLSGRSVVPMLIGFGCSVPAVMSTRTLPSARDRKLTILLIPYMSCSTKTTIYGFFASAFFPGKAGLVMICLYILGVVVGLLVAVAIKLVSHNSEAAPFVMEMPTYRLPVAKNVLRLLWDKTRDFIQMAFTVIFVATIIIWMLRSFNFHFEFVPDGSDSILAGLAGLLAPLFNPLGLGDWRIVTALISGLMAKESVVSTLNVLGAGSAFTALTSVPMLVFCLLYTPCVAAISAIRRELGGKWAASIVVGQCVVAWVCAWIAYLIAGLFMI